MDRASLELHRSRWHFSEHLSTSLPWPEDDSRKSYRMPSFCTTQDLSREANLRPRLLRHLITGRAPLDPRSPLTSASDFGIRYETSSLCTEFRHHDPRSPVLRSSRHEAFDEPSGDTAYSHGHAIEDSPLRDRYAARSHQDGPRDQGAPGLPLGEGPVGLHRAA